MADCVSEIVFRLNCTRGIASTIAPRMIEDLRTGQAGRLGTLTGRLGAFLHRVLHPSDWTDQDIMVISALLESVSCQ